jgi:CheY-like chemotaxis protein
MLEDDRQLASYWQTALEERGYAVVHETDVDRAIEALASAEPFDLVITDILIRDANEKFGPKGGLTLLTHISLNMNRRPKTLAISGANASLNILKHAEMLKATRTLRKPLTAEDVVTAADELLA